MSTSSLSSFIKIHLAVLEKKSKNVKSLRTTDDDDDGRTDDRRCAMTIAHSSLRLRWAKKWSLLVILQSTCKIRKLSTDQIRLKYFTNNKMYLIFLLLFMSLLFPFRCSLLTFQHLFFCEFHGFISYEILNMLSRLFSLSSYGLNRNTYPYHKLSLNVILYHGQVEKKEISYMIRIP